LVDNGTTSTVTVTLGADKLTVWPQRTATITTVPGAFELRSSTADATLELAAGHTYIFNPDAAYDYTTTKKLYGSTILNARPEETKLPAAVVFEAPAVDYLLAPFPETISVQTGPGGPTMLDATTKTALVHTVARAGTAEARGDLRVIAGASGDVTILPARSSLGGGLASIYIDNPTPAPMSVTIDGVAAQTIAAGAHARLDAIAGTHVLAATAGKTTDQTTIDAVPGERWLWSPGGRREWIWETVRYGTDLGLPPEPPRSARALPAIRVNADLLFEAPAQVSGGTLDVAASRTLIRAGKVADFHPAIARELAALTARSHVVLHTTLDPKTASDCTLFALRMVIADAKHDEDEFSKQKGEIARWGCP
ncbi:MAG TPA: hypothetical protein VL463_32520, partial [Kofleriaceae bacterium]|nr:hypothetical protein [Kofleriaceae bacterium]